MAMQENTTSSYKKIMSPPASSELEIENQRLKRRVQEYESLMNNHPQGCLIVQEGRIAYINKMAYELLGYHRDEPLIGREFKKLIDPIDPIDPIDHEDWSLVSAELNTRGEKESSAKGITSSSILSFCVPTNGVEMRIHFKLLSTSISYHGQPATYFIIKDVLEINELSKAVYRTKAILQQTVDAICDGIVVIDKSYTVQMINMKSLRICGEEDFRKVIGRQCFSVFHTRSVPCRNCPLDHIFQTGETPAPVERVIKQNGKENLYQMFSFPLLEKGEVKYVVKYQRDLSREKELQDQLIHSEKLATLGTLAAKISHEINNPLSSIIGMAQLMASQNQDDEQIKLIVTEGLRIKKLAQDLTALSRPSNNEPSDVALHHVLNTVLSLAQKTQGLRNHYQVIREYLPDSPIIYADYDQIEQVFLNLIMNAAYAMQSNSVPGLLTVGTRISPDGKFALGYVKDNGCGIDEKDKPRIFDPFFTTKRGGEGTGIGLSVVKEIVNKHHGRIELKSEVNQGAIFEIFLPLSKTL